MQSISQTNIINKAIELKETSGYIDIIKLAKSVGIDIYFAKKIADENFNARIEFDKKDKSYKIFINPNQEMELQRFSIAHELAHFVLHKKLLEKKGVLNKEPSNDIPVQEEENADKLAAEILMPKELLKQCLKENKITKKESIKKDIITTLAECFRVSKTVVAIRLRDLNYFVPFYSFV
jgi:Zn-dependent peptidase ImmA (M78 family)